MRFLFDELALIFCLLYCFAQGPVLRRQNKLEKILMRDLIIKATLLRNMANIIKWISEENRINWLITKKLIKV